MKLHLHQKISLAWLITLSLASDQSIDFTTGPEVADGIVQAIVVSTSLILAIPKLMSWTQFKKWFCWTDALSANQRAALARGDLRRYYQLAVDESYVYKVTPYFFRTAFGLAVLFGLGGILPVRSGGIELNCILMFVSLYVFLLLVVIFASMPIRRPQ